MKHVKNNPPKLCEQAIFHQWMWRTADNPEKCGKPAKYERLLDDPKAKPMRLCGVHARQAKRRGYVVKPIGE